VLVLQTRLAILGEPLPPFGDSRQSGFQRAISLVDSPSEASKITRARSTPPTFTGSRADHDCRISRSSSLRAVFNAGCGIPISHRGEPAYRNVIYAVRLLSGDDQATAHVTQSFYGAK
jgi:hypothetical protein